MKLSTYTRRIKRFMKNILYLHHKAVILWTVVLGGGVAGWIVYSYLFASYTPEQEVLPQVEVTVNKKGFDRITAWTERKQLSANAIPGVPSTVFYIPVSP